ncbi:MAG: antibiotic biosynthesis monooxygenase family protein [Elstera sp.]|jgi:heme-degrading monooxygenase HmoA
MIFAKTPEPPYWAVIFTNQQSDDTAGYAAMADTMEELAAQQPGFLGIESVRGGDGAGITVSYWQSEADMVAWKGVTAHVIAQRFGKERWYKGYVTRVAQVTRDYAFGAARESE